MVGGLDQRHDLHGGEAGLAAALVVERGDAHQAVRAAFHAHASVGVGSVHLERGGLDAGLFRIGGVHHLGLVAVALGPAQVHAQQHLREVRGIDATGAGADRHDGGTLVVFAVEQGLDLHVVEVLLNALHLGARLGERVGVVFLLAEFNEGLHILDALAGGGEALELGLHGGKLAGHLLRVFGIVPQARFRGLRFEFLGLCLETVDVEGLGNGFVLGASLANRVGIIKFCHRLHHTFLTVFFVF